MEQLFIFLLLILIGYIVGSVKEKRHYRSIIMREKKLINLPVIGFKQIPFSDDKIIESKMVSGNVVIAIDYFKQVLAGLRNVFGGNVTSYESLVDRARREAILRMKENAQGASIIINVKLETSTIGKSSRRNKSTSIEVMAYGTAIKTR